MLRLEDNKQQLNKHNPAHNSFVVIDVETRRQQKKQLNKQANQGQKFGMIHSDSVVGGT